MPFELFLAFRYLRSRHRRRLARVTSLIAIIGIAVGVGALIFAMAIGNGFRDQMRDKILRGTAHITVMRNDGQPMNEFQEVTQKISTVPGVIDAEGTTYDGALIVGPKTTAYAVLRGVDSGRSYAANQIAPQLVSGSVAPLFTNEPENSAAVLLGSELAKRSGLSVGDTAELLGAKSSAAFQESYKTKVRVVGIFRSGLFEYDSTWIYLPLSTATILSGDSHAASVVSVQVTNIYDVKTIGAEIQRRLGSLYTTVDWQEANRPLFTALAFERRIGAVIIGIIILIAALNITTTLILVVTERRRDIAVLSTLGANAKSIMTIFVIEGGLVGVIGALGGLLLGIAAIFVSNHYGLINLPPDVYSISSLQLNTNMRDALLAAIIAFFLSVLATLYPASAATRVRPAEVLRDA